MRKHLSRVVLGLAFTFVLFASPAQAQAALAPHQVEAVVGLLAAFGADASVIANVRATLTGSAATVGTNGSLQFSAGTAPAALEVAPGTNGVPFTTITLFNNTGAPVTLYTMVVERGGSASDSSLRAVSLLRGNSTIATTKSIDERHQARLATNLTLAAGERLDLTVAADLSSRKTSKKTAQLNVVALNASSPVLGSLPVTGTKHTIR